MVTATAATAATAATRPKPKPEPLVVPDVRDDDDEELDPNSPYLTVSQACERYAISRQALHSLCVGGKIPYYTRYSGRRRFLKDEIDQYLGMERHEPTNPLPRRAPKG